MNDNDFIDVTLKVVLSLLRVHAIDNKTGFPFKIYITIAADNDFYS